MRHVKKSLILIIALVLDSAIGSYIGIYGISPRFLLAVVVAMAMSSALSEAGIYGFAAGILADLMWGRTFGFYTLLYMYLAIGARAFLGLVYKNTPAITAGITFLASFLCDAILCFFGFTIWGDGNFLYVLFRMIIPSAAYTGIVQMILFYPVTAICRPKEKRGTQV